MCGIAGVLAFASSDDITESEIERMCGTLVHRGPDGQSARVLPRIGLGHTRLCVIDLETGWQPIWNEDRSVVVVQNGEIYNYRALRAELERRGHTFTTRSDTEVLVHLYEEYGVECVQHLRGMFAFALWDTRRERLLLARDRVGKKPLYYAERNGALVFGSELGALMASTRITPEVDVAALDTYFLYGFIHAPRSILRGVSKLPPAHVLVAEKGEVRVRRYWTVDPSAAPEGRTPRELEEALREKLRESVRLRLQADVPLGCFLSGGIDSSIIAALAAESMDRPLRTFSVGFDEAEYNELPYARLVAERYGTDHEELIVRPRVAEDFPHIVAVADEPVNDSSMVPLYLMAKLARREVTVALGGDGGDEVFAGYSRYRTDGYVAQYQRLPAWLTDRVIGPLVRAVPNGRGPRDIVTRVQRIVNTPRTSAGERYAGWLRRFGSLTSIAGRAEEAYTPLMREAMTGDPVTDPVVEAVATAPGRTRLEKVQWADFTTYLPDDLLVKADRMTMAHGLELRSPLLDQEVVELAATIPRRLRVRGTTGKVILRRAFQDRLPPEIFGRGKRGFNVPIARWLREDLRPLARDLLEDPGATTHTFLKREYTVGILNEHLAGAANHSSRLWSLMFLEMWLRRHDLQGR